MLINPGTKALNAHRRLNDGDANLDPRRIETNEVRQRTLLTGGQRTVVQRTEAPQSPRR